MSAKTELLDLLNDSRINEIYVDGLRSVYVRNTANNAQLRRINTRFTSQKQLMQAIEASLRFMKLDMKAPMLSAKLSCGTQVYATLPPVTAFGPTLSVIKSHCWDQRPFEMAPGWGIASRESLDMYEFGIEEVGQAFIRATGNAVEDAGGAVCQGIRGFGYRGATIRLSARIRTDNVHKAGLFLRVDNPDQAAAVCGEMSPVHGTSDWTDCHVDVAVPDDATLIVFGFWLCHKGTLWVKDLKFEVIQQPPKLRRKKPPQQRPTNMDFAHTVQ